MVKTLDNFEIYGKAMPLFDILDAVKIMEVTLVKLRELIKANPRFVLISRKEFGVECSWQENIFKNIKLPVEVTYMVDETYFSEEMQAVEESWLEEVVVKPACIFRKAVSEMQTKYQTVMKSVQVQKTRSITKTRMSEKIQTEIVSITRKRELDRLFVRVHNGDNSLKIEMAFCLIPSGTFIMGNSRNYLNHQVTISHDFYIGKCPVTQDQWEAVMGSNPSVFKAGYLPVENISWHDVMDFIIRLNSVGKEKFRLPTEAEWEYSSRSGSTGNYCYGNNETQLSEYAWYSGNSDNQPHPVGQKKENYWGLRDMHGNVWEWCQDWFGDYLADEVTDPVVPANGLCRVSRGGSWENSADDATSGGRSRFGDRSYNLGFRLVCLADQ